MWSLLGTSAVRRICATAAVARPQWMSSVAAAAASTHSRPSHVGVLAMEVYFPSTYVSQADLEKYDGVSSGKYTVGLGQRNMAFCGDSEDIVSITMTAVQRLFEKYNISPKDIGRLDVGTETLIDKSKSVKSDLMRLFEQSGNFDVEGADNINACYGGTAAVLNAAAWVESSAWDGRYALVVCGDIAVYEPGPARPTGGVAATAMLIGPDAPLSLVPGLRASYMQNAYDFYKPKLESEYPVVDGQFSITCYYKAIDACYQKVVSKLQQKKGHGSVHDFDHFLLHSPFSKLVQKSFARLPYNDYRLMSDADRQKAVGENKELAAALALPYEETFGNKEFDKTFIAASKKLFEHRVAPGTFLSEELGNSYTASLWASLVGTVAKQGDHLIGKRVLMFSYGSGLCSTMFVLAGRKTASPVFTLANIQRQLDLENRLAQRVKVDPETFTQVLAQREKSYGTNDLKPVSGTQYLAPGTYYLTSVDKMYRRTYGRVE